MSYDLSQKYKNFLNYIQNNYEYFNAVNGVEAVINFPLADNDIKRFYDDDLCGDISVMYVDKYNVYTLCLRQQDIFEILHGYMTDNSPINFKDSDNMDLKRYNFDNDLNAIKAFNKFTGEDIPLNTIE